MKENIFNLKKTNIVESVSKSAIFSQEIPFKNIIILSFFINIIGAGSVFLIRKNFLPPEVPLFYGFPEGESQITTSINLVLPFIFSITVISINIILASFIKDEFLKKTLILSSLVTTFFSLITILKIIFLVGSL
jgi:hypothetical protein